LYTKHLSDFKQKVHDSFEEVINDKICLLQKSLQDLIDSTKNETKSSAGDKYETTRAMLQIEQDNIKKQFQQALEQKAAYEKTDFNTGTEMIKKGSLVNTDKGYFFISTSLGKINMEGFIVRAISPQSPLGSQLIGLKTSEIVKINGVNYTVKSIY